MSQSPPETDVGGCLTVVCDKFPFETSVVLSFLGVFLLYSQPHDGRCELNVLKSPCFISDGLLHFIFARSRITLAESILNVNLTKLNLNFTQIHPE